MSSPKTTALKEFPSKATLLEMEMKVMKMIATDEPLSAVLDQVTRNFEKNIEGSLCSILLMDKSSVHVLHGSGPSLPEEYNNAIHGLAIGPAAGSCGTAAFKKKRIIVSDIANDPLWVEYKDLALGYGLKACWSTPILRNNGEVLGTFAIYYKEVKAPDEIDLELIDRSASQVKIAIEQHLRALDLSESEEKYRSLAEGLPDSISRYDREIRLIYANPTVFRLIGLNPEDVIGKTHREMGFNETISGFRDKSIKRVFETGKPLRTQFDWHGVDGTINFDWHLNPEFDLDGNVKSVLGVGRDITKLKEAEREIVKREKFLTVVIDNFPNSFVSVVDKDLKVVFSGGEEFTKANLDPEFYNGRNIAGIFEEYGKEKAELIVDAYLKTLRGEPQVFELKLNDQYHHYKTVPLITDADEINSLLVVTENITEKREAEIALAKSELLFSKLATSVPVGIFQTDLSGSCIYVNEELIKYAGISFEEAMADGWISAIHPDDEGRVLIEWQNAVSNRKEFNSEFRFRTRQGKITWLAARAVVLYDASDKPYGYIGIALDITDQKGINALLEENEKRFRTTLERITDGFAAVDNEWRFTYLNSRGGEIFGFNPNEIIGQNAKTLFPDGLGRPFYFAYAKAMRHQEYIYLEEYYPPHKKWYENHIYPSLGGVSIYFRDITERKQDEEKLFKAIESLELAEAQALLGSWEFDFTHGKRTWSKQMFRLFGFTPGPEAPTYEKLMERIHPEDRDAFERNLKVILGGEMPEHFLVRTNPELLSLRYLLTHWNVERDNKGKAVKARGTIQDITSRIVAERKTKESEEKYRTLVEQAADAIFLVDLEGNYLEANEGASMLMGYSIEELKKMNGSDLVWGEDLQRIPLQTEEIKSGNVVFIERVLRRKDNSLINVEITAKLMNSGKVNVIIRDVTERFLARQEIRESEEKYRTLVDQASDGIFITNASSQFIQVNKMACTMLGYTGDELLKLTPVDLAVIKKGDTPLRISEVKENKALIQERLLKRKDGTTFYAEISATKLNNGNALSIVRDITERKNTERALAESENRLRTILDNEPECVKILNRKGELIDMNPAGLAMIEADSLQGVKGANIISLVDEPYKEDFAELTRNVFKGITGKLEFGITGLKGRRLWMETHAVPFRDAEGKIISLLAVTRDVTDRKNAEEKIKQYTNQLKDLTIHLQHVREEERAALSRELHDELGQQLTAMKMDLSWINKRVDSDQISSKLQEIMHLIHDAVSTLRRINSELRPSLLDDLGLFAALEHQATEFSDRYGIPCTSRVTIDEPEFDQHYKIAIFRIFQETLNNIAKHSNATKVKIEIKEEEEQFHFIISDNGKGFNAKTDKKAKSFGILGMTERAMMMNGALSVKSKAGKGTTLHLSIPVNSVP